MLLMSLDLKGFAEILNYIEENKSKPENLGISIKNYDRMMVVVEFFEKLIEMNP